MTPLIDLQESGLSPESIAAMRVATISPEQLAERGVIGHGGYSIPYFDFRGKVIPDVYRIKLIPPIDKGGKTIKYLHPRGASNHAYLPPIIPEDMWMDPGVPLIITEGEKKAMAAAQEGLCCMGLSGVDSWRSRSVKVTAGQLTKSGEDYSIKLSSSDEVEMLQEKVIEELRAIPLEDRQVFLCFDSPDILTNPNVQRASFELAVWLQDQGADVLVIILPIIGEQKVGLDDFFLEYSAEDFWKLPTTFPTHPRIKGWLRRTLDDKFLKRSGMVRCARAVINILDQRGQRYVDSDTGAFYYYDKETSILHTFGWGSQDLRQMRLGSFGNLVQDVFGIGTSDGAVLSRIADLYTSGRKIKSIRPRRVSYCTDDALYYQLDDSSMVKVTASRIEVLDNGSDDVLFLSGQVDPLPISPFLELTTGSSSPSASLREPGGKAAWLEVLEQVNLQPMEGMTIEETRGLVACIFYLSPWFRRWRGLMLPAELLIAEPNSGKTFLCNLRQSIWTGNPSLKNAPPSLKDWYASVSGAPGMWICDNVGDMERGLKEQLSDEIARLVTDPRPAAEMRKLFTTSDRAVLELDTTFVVTAIKSPFWKPDILQRSIVLRMKAIPAGQRDSAWYQRQVEGVGRVERVIDHLLVAQRFLAAVKREWNDHYLSGHRLVHFEQALLRMGEALGLSELVGGAVGKLFGVIQSQIADFDPVLEALRIFVDEWREKPRHDGAITARDIIDWVDGDVDARFTSVRMLRNPVALGKYISTHTYDVQEVVGLIMERRNNQNVYHLKPKAANGAIPHD